ncbi:hypothetical protein [Tenacibaculum sp. 190524A02b]|uniref:hypothetical protein n=1 Tax=Tenacibaculum vairaonense TaxID=3137860 RepID=UPI0031FB2D8C
MKKSILNLGKSLNKTEQQNINGGKVIRCSSHPLCSHLTGFCLVVANKFCGGSL